MRQALLLVALALLAAGAAAGLAFGVERRWPRIGTYSAGAAASALVSAVGVLSVMGRPLNLDLGDLLAFGHTVVRLDPLAGLFLTLTGGLGALVSVALSSGTGSPRRVGTRATGAGYMVLLAAVTVVIIAADAFTFLFAWEGVTVAFYVLSAATRERADQPDAAWATAAIGKVGGAALLFGLLLLAGASGSFGFASWAAVHPGGLHDTAYALVVFGFATKVGLVPFQVWMPRGYPAAPGAVRAAMAGMAVNVGFYGMWRFLGLLGRPPEWLAVTVLVLGGVTALLGIAFAAVQADIDRVLAYSSAENGGLIVVGYGLALAGAYAGNSSLVAVGLLAGSLQALAHAVAKSGLFLAAADFEAVTGTTSLDQLSGMARSRPWSSLSLAASAVTLAGLPPTVGFVSEWFIFEALMQQFRLRDLALRLATASAGALVALTAGVAALTFVRLVGFTVMGGADRATQARGADGNGVAAKVPMAAVPVLCLGLAAFAPWVVRFLARGLAPDVPSAVTLGALKSPWVLQPVFGNFSALSPSWLFIAFAVGLVAVTGATVLASKGRFLSVRRVPPWRSATPGVHGEDSYTAFAYANPLRHVLANILGTQKEVTRENGSRAPAVEGGAGAELSEEDHSHVSFSASVAEPVESYFYRPGLRGYLALVAAAKRLQSGRLEAYVAYMLVALVTLLVVAASVR
ncbi:MAG TPA: proton-conducting transporter membrane subunit [Acidimicrobiales bacterium]|nr:proton-conducting transporter membrane subunit [Acidimicrobiales bacterium]